MAEKSGFILYREQYEGIETLSLEERGRLITALFEYFSNGKPSIELTPSAKMAYTFIKAQIDRDNEKYKQTCEKRRQNALSATKCKQMQAKASKRHRYRYRY